MNFLRAQLTSLRLTFRWSNSTQTWHERVGDLVLLTPAYVGGAIAEEKDRKTLEFMLATDLLNREIVLSKLGSRLANLALVVITGLPILSILQFLGGVDPNMILAGFAITAMTVV